MIRERGKTLHALEERTIVTCAAARQLAFSTAGTTSTDTFTVQSSAADAVGIAGRTIDRLGDELRTRYYYAEPFAYLFATRGSTEANRFLSLEVALQHGDSSGAGDMAAFSTVSNPGRRNFFSPVGSTEMGLYSSGSFYGQTPPSFYDLRPAKRYIRTLTYAFKNRVTTESSGDEHLRVGGGLSFRGADELPDQANSTGVGSTSTTT